MQNKYDITDAELEIMQVLWQKKECSLNEIIESISNDIPKNKNTIKTLIRRLMLKNSITSRKIGLKDTVYVAKVDEKKFLSLQNENFLNKLYDGSTNKLLMNFVENKKISKEELESLIEILESED